MSATLTLALDGQPPQQLPTPTSWADVTLAQYVAAAPEFSLTFTFDTY